MKMRSKERVFFYFDLNIPIITQNVGVDKLYFTIYVIEAHISTNRLF